MKKTVKRYRWFREMHDEAINHSFYWISYLEFEIQNAVWKSRVLKDHRKYICRMVEKAAKKISKMAEGVKSEEKKANPF